MGYWQDELTAAIAEVEALECYETTTEAHAYAAARDHMHHCMEQVDIYEDMYGSEQEG